VFTNELGGPVDPRNLLRVIEVAAKAVGVECVGVHKLRHSAAVAWLESGVHVKAVADLLGHSSIAITGDVYGHTSDDTACVRLTASLRGSASRRPLGDNRRAAAGALEQVVGRPGVLPNWASTSPPPPSI
jgi:integrase-like protein